MVGRPLPPGPSGRNVEPDAVASRVAPQPSSLMRHSGARQAILAIDPSAFGDPEAFRRRVDTVVRDMRGSQRMPGVDRIWLPGEQSHAKRVANKRDGVPIVPALAASLDKLATELGIEKLKGPR